MSNEETCFFDPRGIDRDPVPEVVDAGQYLVCVEKAKKKENNNGLGLFLFLKVLSPGVSKGKVIMDFFNIEHMNQEAARIGKQNLARVLDALGKGDVRLMKETDLEGCKLKIDVEVQPHYKNPTDSQNRITRYLPLSHVDLNLLSIKTDEKGRMALDDVPF